MARWGYIKGQGRWYQRKTGTKRFPDSGVVKSNGRQVGLEKVGHHHYGVDKIKPKKTVSKIYKRHSFKSKKGKKSYRGGYRRGLR